MTVTIPDVMRHVRNYFVAGRTDATWQVRAGLLTPQFFSPGDWVAILDGPAAGVCQLTEEGALPGVDDATWTGRICLLTPPAGFLRLCSDIAEWARDHADPTLVSESFGAYSRRVDNRHWTQVFAPDLAPYTRMYTEVNL